MPSFKLMPIARTAVSLSAFAGTLALGVHVMDSIVFFPGDIIDGCVINPGAPFVPSLVIGGIIGGAAMGVSRIVSDLLTGGPSL